MSSKHARNRSCSLLFFASACLNCDFSFVIEEALTLTTSRKVSTFFCSQPISSKHIACLRRYLFRFWILCASRVGVEEFVNGALQSGKLFVRIRDVLLELRAKG